MEIYVEARRVMIYVWQKHYPRLSISRQYPFYAVCASPLFPSLKTYLLGLCPFVPNIGSICVAVFSLPIIDKHI